MNIVIQPELDGIAAERFRLFAQQISGSGITDANVTSLVAREANWARRCAALNGQTHAYEASVRLLGDLRLLKWSVRADPYGVELDSPPNPRLGGASAMDVLEAKETVRRELGSALAQQFADPLVRKFIDDLEAPVETSQRKSVLNLIADGAEVRTRLNEAINSNGKDRFTALKKAIQPYLQLVPGEGEVAKNDEFTGIPLGDIWRYFRYTWAIPQLAIPGRQMFYLVRDAAHPTHAIIGIAALSNSPLVSPLRDAAIGWMPEHFYSRCVIAAKNDDSKELRRLFKMIDELITSAMSEIDASELATENELQNPTEELVSRLQRRADEFASRREVALREVADAASAGVPLSLHEVEESDYGIPPVALDLLELEGKKAPAKSAETLARRLLVVKKRAFELARLSRAKIALQNHKKAFANPAEIPSCINNSEFQGAVNTALLSAKGEKVGTNILEITTCGAVAPYNGLLGGKLVALLLLSPEVADDYRLRYQKRPAIISSQLKNEERTKNCAVAWLNTTSLYSAGSSQYERLRLPAGTFSPSQPELRFEHIGDTEGYGTVQFADATVQAVQKALEEKNQFRGVNSIFGEGFSPKFRKMRDGMSLLGFNPTVLMRHDQKRRMYAVKMWDSAPEFLRGETSDAPDYIRKPQQFRAATESIAEFWRTRWLASRLNHRPAVEELAKKRQWALSERLTDFPINERSLKSRPKKNAGMVQTDKISQGPKSGSCEGTPSFWRELALAGPEACADELPIEKLESLHVSQGLDKFLIDHVKRGFSIVLTGNAGDGKTHLLRRLEPLLKQQKADVELDATAAMKPNDVSHILRRWQEATRKGRPFCIAANEYPLHLLRKAGAGWPVMDEVNRQCEHRLVYSPKPDGSEAAQEKVIVVDLSLRNPLAPEFLQGVFERILSDADLNKAALTDPEGDLAWNLARLKQKEIRLRLINLFSRIAATGNRTSVRELWIWIARLILGTGDDDRKPVRSPGRWYSSRLFDHDARFHLSVLLRRFADPAHISHPRWDVELERGKLQTGWITGEAPLVAKLDFENFVALKRRFFFEHQFGQEILKLEGVSGARLLDVLSSGKPPEAVFKQFLIRGINQAYCPELFSTMSTRLYLWIGHRFHEQPSHGYVANQSVSDSELLLLCPRLPKRLEGAFQYQPDHLTLQYGGNLDSAVRLRIDFQLFVALEKLAQGLPRQLLPDRELNRLDAFLEQLRRAGIQKTREFFVHNHDERTSAQIVIAQDMRAFESVKTA